MVIGGWEEKLDKYTEKVYDIVRRCESTYVKKNVSCSHFLLFYDSALGPDLRAGCKESGGSRSSSGANAQGQQPVSTKKTDGGS